MMKLVLIYLISFSILVLSIISCEQEITPVTSENDSQYVVESYLENSTNALPPYLFLTKSLGFYTSFDSTVLKKLFVNNAIVNVIVDQQIYSLQEVCVDQLSPDLRKQVLENFGYNGDSISVNFCAYIDLNKSIPVLTNKNYKLEIIIGTDTVRSFTTIPSFVSLDSLWIEDVPGKGNDSFAQLFCIINDAPNVADYYRYFTAGQNETLMPNFASVTNDFFFNGQKFKFSLSKARPPGEDFNDNSGYFRRGDSIRIKWCNIDKAHYDFWNTLEVSRTRQGPFSSYVRIKGNIQNGLGIFGGQNCETYTVFVPKK